MRIHRVFAALLSTLIARTAFGSADSRALRTSRAIEERLRAHTAILAQLRALEPKGGSAPVVKGADPPSTIGEGVAPPTFAAAVKKDMVDMCVAKSSACSSEQVLAFSMKVGPFEVCDKVASDGATVSLFEKCACFNSAAFGNGDADEKFGCCLDEWAMSLEFTMNVCKKAQLLNAECKLAVAAEGGNIFKVGDGQCDSQMPGYNTEACGYDGGDCCRASCHNFLLPCGVGKPFDCLDPELRVPVPTGGATGATGSATGATGSGDEDSAGSTGWATGLTGPGAAGAEEVRDATEATGPTGAIGGVEEIEETPREERTRVVVAETVGDSADLAMAPVRKGVDRFIVAMPVRLELKQAGDAAVSGTRADKLKDAVSAFWASELGLAEVTAGAKVVTVRDAPDAGDADTTVPLTLTIRARDRLSAEALKEKLSNLKSGLIQDIISRMHDIGDCPLISQMVLGEISINRNPMAALDGAGDQEPSPVAMVRLPFAMTLAIDSPSTEQLDALRIAFARVVAEKLDYAPQLVTTAVRLEDDGVVTIVLGLLEYTVEDASKEIDQLPFWFDASKDQILAALKASDGPEVTDIWKDQDVPAFVMLGQQEEETAEGEDEDEDNADDAPTGGATGAMGPVSRPVAQEDLTNAFAPPEAQTGGGSESVGDLLDRVKAGPGPTDAMLRRPPTRGESESMVASATGATGAGATSSDAAVAAVADRLGSGKDSERNEMCVTCSDKHLLRLGSIALGVANPSNSSSSSCLPMLVGDVSKDRITRPDFADHCRCLLQIKDELYADGVPSSLKEAQSRPADEISWDCCLSPEQPATIAAMLQLCLIVSELPPKCRAKTETPWRVGDGRCDSDLMTEECGKDGGDCCKESCNGRIYSCTAKSCKVEKVEEQEPEEEQEQEQEEEQEQEAKVVKIKPAKVETPSKLPYAYTAEAEILFRGVSVKHFQNEDGKVMAAVRKAIATAIGVETKAVSFSRLIPEVSAGTINSTLVKVQVLATTLPAAQRIATGFTALLGGSALLGAQTETNSDLPDTDAGPGSLTGAELIKTPTVEAIHTYEVLMRAAAALAIHRDESSRGSQAQKRCASKLDETLPLKSRTPDKVYDWCRDAFAGRGMVQVVGKSAIENACGMFQSALDGGNNGLADASHLCAALHVAANLYIRGDITGRAGQTFPDVESLGSLTQVTHNVESSFDFAANVGHHFDKTKSSLDPDEIDTAGGDSCCKPHKSKGCNNKEIEKCVCNQMAFCKKEWDQVCVNAVTEYNCDVKHECT